MIDSSDFGHSRCVMCGRYNPASLKLSYEAEGDGAVRASFIANHELQGYDGVLHGGVVSALLDSAMTNCLFSKGIRALTGELKVRFLKSVPCDSRLELSARLLSAKSRLLVVSAELVCENELMAKAEAKFVPLKS